MEWSETLFVRSYDELSDGTRARDDYERLKIAAVLRRLLLDASPLVHQANRTHKKKLRFCINKVGDISELPVKPDLLFHAHGLDPKRFQIRDGTVDLKLDQFLAQPLIELQETVITIADVIKFAANKVGGVHLDATRDAHEMKIDAALAKVSASGMHPLAIALETVATITLTALKPLREAIAKLPPAFPLIAWYKRERDGAVYFAGRGQFLETNFKEPVANGISWNSVLRIMPQAQRGNRVIYEIGNADGSPPRLSIKFGDDGGLSALAEINGEVRLAVRADQFDKSPFFDRSAYIAVDLYYEGDNVQLALYVNNQRVAHDAKNGIFTQRSMDRHTIGSALDGGNSATFEMREMVLGSRCPSLEERAALAEYLWLQWHG